MLPRIFLLVLLNLLLTNLYSNNDPSYAPSKLYKDSINHALDHFNLEEATDCAIHFVHFSKEEEDFDHYLDAVYLAYYCYARQNRHTEALVFLRNELEWNEKLGRKKNILNLNYFIALLYKDINDIPNAHRYFLSTLDKLETSKAYSKTEALSLFHYIYTDLATVLIDSDALQSLQYLQKAHTKALSLNDTLVIADSYLNIGWANIEIQKFKLAETYLDSAYVLFKEKNSIKGRASIFLEKGIIQRQKKQPKEALAFFHTAYEIIFGNEEIVKGSYFLRHKTLEQLSLTLKSQDELKEALIYGLENLKLSQTYKVKSHIASDAKVVAELYDLDQHPELALTYYKLSNENYQLLEEEDSKLHVLKQEYLYQSNKDKQALSKAVVLNNKSKRNNWLLSSIILLLSIIALLYIRMMNFKFNIQSNVIEEKEKLITQKTKSMSDISLINQSNNQYIDELKENLKKIYENSEKKSPELKKLISKLKRTANKEEEWKRFRKYHAELDPNFYQEIQNNWPDLTNLDIRHCTLIKLKLSIKEAAEVLGISPKSVQMARYRLKKKLAYESQDSLKKFLMSI